MLARLCFVAVVSVSVWCSSIAVGGPVFKEPKDLRGATELGGARGLIRVDVGSAEAVARLKQVLRSWDVAGTVDAGRSLDLVVTERERLALVAAGVPFDDVEIEPAPRGPRAEYHSFAEMEAGLAAMATNYPSITQLISLGLSWEGRDLWSLEITDNPGVDEGEPSVQFMGLTHAREWPTLEVSLDIADRLTSGYGSSPTITDLINNRRIWIIPCVNPDGLVYSQDIYEWWRKNRRNLGDGVYGVDLNRNFSGAASGSKDGQWGSIGTGLQTHNPNGSTYVGPGPFSEPETQSIRDFFDGRDVTISISYHTYGDLVLWPWGYDGSVQTDDNALLVSIGQGMAAAIGGYVPQQASALYPTTGASDDWAYGWRYYEQGRNTLAYTVEIGSEYHPSQSQLQALLNENWDGAMYVLQQAAGAQSQLTPFVLPPILSTPAQDEDGDFTVSWVQRNPDAGANLYALQELTGLSRLTDGAESGTGNWNLQEFSDSTARAHSGVHSFKSPSGDEEIGAMTTTDPLPVEAGDDLTFWTWYDIETDWDMAFVEVSIDGRQFDVLDKFTGSSGGWTQKTYGLGGYEGRSIYLRFRYTTDSSVTQEGFYVDDVFPVASWSSMTTLSSSITETSYAVTGHSEGDYYYRVRGSNPTRGFGEYSDLGMTHVGQTIVDCNGNGIDDSEDISSGYSLDCNANGIPDECEYPGCPGILLGDMNCDGLLNGEDIQRFVDTMAAQRYTCQADMPPQNGAVDLDDVAGFLDALLAP